MVDMGQIGVFFGAYYGILAAASYSPKIISGQVVDDTWMRFILRFVVMLAVTLPWRFIYPPLVKKM